MKPIRYVDSGKSSCCGINQQARDGILQFKPIEKTPTGCILECYNGKSRKIRNKNKICDELAKCPLLKGKPIIQNNDDDDLDDDDDDYDDEDFLQDFSQNPILPIIVTGTPTTAPLVPFLTDCCAKGGEVDNSVLKAQYKQWCNEQTQEEISPKNFKKVMNSLGFIQKNNPERTWENIQLIKAHHKRLE